MGIACAGGGLLLPPAPGKLLLDPEPPTLLIFTSDSEFEELEGEELEFEDSELAIGDNEGKEEREDEEGKATTDDLAVDIILLYN
jgi:hypothetical protein